MSMTGNMELAVNNPFRYRGYYYDVESGLYYLNSRYYDPQTGRFINADDTDTLLYSLSELTDKNLLRIAIIIQLCMMIKRASSGILL